MALVLNLIIQTVAWFGFMGAIIFGAAGTLDYAGGWLFLGEMIAFSDGFRGCHMVRVDPGLLRERLKPPIQKDQPLADRLILIPAPAPDVRQHGVHGGGRRALALVDHTARHAMGGKPAPRRGAWRSCPGPCAPTASPRRW